MLLWFLDDIVIQAFPCLTVRLCFTFSALTQLIGQQEGHLARKKTECWFADGCHLSVALHVFRVVSAATVSCFSTIDDGLIIWYWLTRVVLKIWLLNENCLWMVQFYHSSIWCCVRVDSGWCQTVDASHWLRPWSSVARKKLRWKLSHLRQRKARGSISQLLGTDTHYIALFIVTCQSALYCYTNSVDLSFQCKHHVISSNFFHRLVGQHSSFSALHIVMKF